MCLLFTFVPVLYRNIAETTADLPFLSLSLSLSLSYLEKPPKNVLLLKRCDKHFIFQIYLRHSSLNHDSLKPQVMQHICCMLAKTFHFAHAPVLNAKWHEALPVSLTEAPYNIHAGQSSSINKNDSCKYRWRRCYIFCPKNAFERKKDICHKTAILCKLNKPERNAHILSSTINLAIWKEEQKVI